MAGLVAALSLPSWGWWPLGFAGTCGLSLLLRERPAPARLMIGAAFGLGFFTPGLWWMGEFNVAGAALVVLLETSFVAVATVAVPPGRGRALALPACLVLAEAVRGAVPFGGLPMSGLALGQADGPLAGSARLGGHLLVLAVTVVTGVALAQAVSRRWQAATLAAGVALGGAAAGAVAPDGGDGPPVRVAVVQGGGRRGFQAVEGDPSAVLAAHVAASRLVRPPVDLVVWPEDVIDVDGPVAGTPEDHDVAAVAQRVRVTLVAGVVEGAGTEHFRNVAVAWRADGAIVDRFEKVRRVPFGEYVPGRAFFDRFADLSAIPRDAVPGRGPGLLRAPVADLGVMVSYEVFFADRGRGATRAGAELLLVPTNAASFSTSQVPSQQLASARLRAIESGRDLVQAAPTGYSAVIDHRGRMVGRTTLGRRQVLHHTVMLRSGTTPYTRAGDTPVLVGALLGLGAAWVTARRTSPAAEVLPATGATAQPAKADRASD